MDEFTIKGGFQLNIYWKPVLKGSELGCRWWDEVRRRRIHQESLLRLLSDQ